MPPTAGYTLLKKNEESGDASESDERVAFRTLDRDEEDGIGSSSPNYPLIHTSPRTRARFDGGEDGTSLSDRADESYDPSSANYSRKCAAYLCLVIPTILTLSYLITKYYMSEIRHNEYTPF